MLIKQGRYRKVFIFNSFVIKIPKSFTGYLSNIDEINSWYRYKELKWFMCPILFHDPICLIIFMKKADVITNDLLDGEELNNIIDKYPLHPVLDDIHKDNFGIINERIVKIDWGRDYWLHNLAIDYLPYYSKWYIKKYL